MNTAPTAAQPPHAGNRSGWFITLAILSLGCGIILLVYCLRLVTAIEHYSGFHTGRAGIVLLAILLGSVGTILAALTLRFRPSARSWSVSLVAFNLVVALGAVTYACWPRTPELLRAVHQGNVARVRWYATLGVNLDARGRWGWTWDCEGETPLTKAVQKGDIRMVQTLLDAGASIHAKDGWN